MKSLKAIFAIACIISSNLVFGQEPSFYDLNFSMDSTSTPYKSSGSNYVFIRSKRGTEPIKATSSGDSIKSFAIQQIVLVFSESSTSEIENRESYNQERWENLMPTYPEFFQTNTTYKNICQCSQDAASPSYKEVQGFYIYYTPKAGSQPKKEVEVAKTEIAKPAETQKDIVKEEPKKVAEVVKSEVPKAVEPKKEIVKEEPKKVAEVTKKEEPKKEVEVVKTETPKSIEPQKDIESIKKVEPKKTKEVVAKVEEVKPVEVVKKEEPKKVAEVVKTETPKVIEPKKEIAKEETKKVVEVAKKEEPKKVKEVVAKVEEVKPVEVVKTEEPKKEVEVITPVSNANAEVVSDTKSKAPVANAKPRKSKDPKACRTACYGNGDNDLNDFLRDNVAVTKKMKRDEVDLKLQLNVDGTIKKVVAIGDNDELNKLVEVAVKDMIWNASVRSGLTIKSEVKMILKYDKKTKSLKAEELTVNPRLGPKCMTCTSDDELFAK